MPAITDDLLTPDEASCYLLYHRSPGMTQEEIAAKKGWNQSKVCRVLKRATAKFERLKQIVKDAGGDVEEVEQYVHQIESRRQKRPLAA